MRNFQIWVPFALSLGLLLSNETVQAQAGTPVPSSQAEKSELRVLLVSQNPEALRGRAAAEEGRSQELYKMRSADFQALLEQHFKSVQVVYAADYSVGLSKSVDVTLFDAVPNALKEAVQGKDPLTGEAIYEPAQYLPLNFDSAAVMIADASPRIGEALGTKLDWL